MEVVEQDEGGLILRVCFLTSFPEILSFFSFSPMSFNPVCVCCECVFTFVMCVEFGTYSNKKKRNCKTNDRRGFVI